MPTQYQERLADEIIKEAKQKKRTPKTHLLRKVGYSGDYADNRPSQIMKAEGVKIALKERGFTEQAAKDTVSAILHGKKTKDDTKLRACDMIFRCFGSYAAEKQVIATANVSLKELFELSQKDKENPVRTDYEKT